MADENVTKNRHKYLGGSDIPIILGISSFKTRWDLLLEKARIKESEFTGNLYTEYGNIMEPIIRDYTNEQYDTTFEVKTFVDDKFRSNVDGIDDTTVLEIKTSSDPFKNIEIYKSQLIFYMIQSGKEEGLLALYERDYMPPPDNFNLDYFKSIFDPFKLTFIKIYLFEEQELLNKIKYEIARFLNDLETIQTYHGLGFEINEELLISNEVVTVSRELELVEQKIKELKKAEDDQKALKKKLYDSMVKHSIKSWETPTGVKITLIPEKNEEKIVKDQFNLEQFQLDYPDLYDEYLEDVTKPNKKAGYVKITHPKIKGETL